MLKHPRGFTSLFAFAALPLAVACGDDPSDPVPLRPPPPVAVAVADMSLAPANVMLDPGESVQLMAELTGFDGTPLASGDVPRIRWTSSRPAVVEVSRGGVLMARTAGKAVITAECGNRYAKASVTVLPAGDIDPPDRLRESGGTVR